MQGVKSVLSRGIFLGGVLYAVSLLTSMAGMEIFGWLCASLLVFIVTFFSRDFSIRWQRTGLEIPLFGFLFIALVGVYLIPDIRPEDRSFVAGSLRWVFLFFALYLCFLNRLFSSKIFLKTWVVTGFFVGCYAIVQVFVGWDIFRSSPYQPTSFFNGNLWRAKGFFSNPITFANSMGMMVLFFCGYLSINLNSLTKKWQNCAILMLIVLLCALVLSLTRGVWLGLFAVCLLFGLLRRRKSIFKALALVLTLLVLIFSLFSPLRDHLKSGFSPSHSSIDKRLRLWSSNWQMFKEHPLLGVGLHQNVKHVQKYHIKVHRRKGMESHAHNVFLHVLAGTGVFGFIFFIWLFIKILWDTLSSYFKELDPQVRGIALGAFLSTCCLVVSGLTEVNFFDGEVTHMFLMIVSCFYGVKSNA